MLNKIIQVIKRSPFPVVTSIDPKGYPSARTMGLVENKSTPPKILYFSTNTSSQHVAHYRKNQKACVYFKRIRGWNFEGVCLCGTMEVLEDDKTKKDFWTPLSRLFYKSCKDPDYCILLFTATKARYYQAQKSTDIVLK